MFKLNATKFVKKYLNKCSKGLNNFIVDQLETLGIDPEIGDPLERNLYGYWSLHFEYKDVEYRAVYEYSIEKNEVTVCYIGTRENFYKNVKRHLGIR